MLLPTPTLQQDAYVRSNETGQCSEAKAGLDRINLHGCSGKRLLQTTASPRQSMWLRRAHRGWDFPMKESTLPARPAVLLPGGCSEGWRICRYSVT